MAMTSLMCSTRTCLANAPQGSPYRLHASCAIQTSNRSGASTCPPLPCYDLLVTSPTKIRFFALTLASLFFVAACGGGSSAKFPATVAVDPNAIGVIPINTEFVLGENRFAIGLLSPTTGAPIVDADVKFRFYDLNDGEQFKFEADGISRVPARDAGIEEQVEHIHADGTVHTHFNAGEEIGIYTAMVNFDRPGDWGVEIKVEKRDENISGTLLPRFVVTTTATTPPVGIDAPRTENRTIYDVDDISLIDSSTNPSEEMHTTTIKAAIEAGRPTLVLFAVPGFCTSRLCGPELDIMRKLYPEWKDRVEFIHVEFFEDPGTNRIVTEAAQEWGLRTEPWFFLIDANGKIAAKFEGPTAMQELVDAMTRVTAGN